MRHLLGAGLLLALVVSCSGAGDTPGHTCDDAQKKAAAVSQRTDCIQKFCAGNGTAACACVVAGKDFDRTSCACTGNLSAAAETTVCGASYDVSGDADCSVTNLELTSALTTSACKPCTNKYQCGRGQICKLSACVDGCEEDLDCVQPGTSRICEGSTCLDGCHSDLDCQVAAGGNLDHYCSASICHDGCFDDLSCESWQTCSAHACVGKSCSDDSFCAGHTCVAGRCQ